MIQAVAIVIEVILAILVVGILFLLETGTNFSPVKNMRKAYNRLKDNIRKHQLD
jgi:hypothetical protein